MKLHNVIGGLEEKEEIYKKNKGIGGNVYTNYTERGHNQLCNREVGVDTDEIEKIFIEHIVFQFAHKEELGGYTRALIKAIEQGKILKITKEAEDV